jgi:adenylate cyclase
MVDEGFTPEGVRAWLTGESPRLAKQRRVFRRIPSDPRCKLCAAPFGGLGGLIFKQAGYKQSLNPALCTKCITALRKRDMTGVEIPITLLFSDLRGSTAIGERMRPADFHTFLDSFYQLASKSIAAHNGIIDKVVGDEVIGLFFGGISGPHHAAAAVAAAIDLAERAARADTTTSVSIPVGTAVHTGEAFVGATRLGTTEDDFTALGDVVNITARLASAAVAGEVIVSVAAAEVAGVVTDTLQRRTVEIRGRTEPIEVVVLRP